MNARFTQHAVGRRVVAFILALVLILITAAAPALMSLDAADAGSDTGLPLMACEGSQSCPGGGG